MKLSTHAISKLVPFVAGDNHEPYRTATQILELFNEFGGYNYLPSNGLPMMPNSYLRYSRKTFTECKLAEMNESAELCQLLEHVINQIESPDALQQISEILVKEGYSVVKLDDRYRISGGVIDNTTPIATEAYFRDIEQKVLSAIDTAKVSLRIAMAWFTNEKIKDKLIEKKHQGVDIDILIYKDGVNDKHGVDLSEFSHTFVKGSGGGIMHNKYCVIDNQMVLAGSYNWTTNAETRNDENVMLLKDPQSATDYSVEFMKLKNNNKKQVII